MKPNLVDYSQFIKKCEKSPKKIDTAITVKNDNNIFFYLINIIFILVISIVSYFLYLRYKQKDLFSASQCLTSHPTQHQIPFSTTGSQNELR